MDSHGQMNRFELLLQWLSTLELYNVPKDLHFHLRMFCKGSLRKHLFCLLFKCYPVTRGTVSSSSMDKMETVELTNFKAEKEFRISSMSFSNHSLCYRVRCYRRGGKMSY